MTNSRRLLSISFVCLSLFAHSKAFAQKSGPAKLELDEFLEQVSTGNEMASAAKVIEAASIESALEPGLMLKPSFFAGASMTSDAKPNPFFPYQRLETSNYNVGVQNQFSFGLQAKFSFAFADYNYVGIAPKYFEGRPQLEASLPLLRNGFGRETKYSILAGEKGALAKAAAQEATGRSILLDAEAAYWRLAITREALRISKASVDRAQAMFDWTSRRVRLSLSDRSENLQASAQLKARKLDYRIAEDDARSARLAFNAARGRQGDLVTEDLTTFNSKFVSTWKTPERLINRPDVKASILQAESAEAQALATAERTKANLEVYGLYAFNSPQRGLQADAFNDSWSSNRPTSTVGVRFNMPLDFESTEKIQEAWSAEARANRSIASRKAFDQERDWIDTLSRFELAKEKLKLYEELETAQKEKLDHERNRQRSGKSTVAQVILFESDYDQAAFARIRAMAELLNLNSLLKLYAPATKN